MRPVGSVFLLRAAPDVAQQSIPSMAVSATIIILLLLLEIQGNWDRGWGEGTTYLCFRHKRLHFPKLEFLPIVFINLEIISLL